MKKCFYVFLILALTGCVNRNVSTNGAKEVLSVPDLVYETFEDVVSEYDFVQLETTDASIIGRLNKIKVYNGKIYILTQAGYDKLLVFDITGKFIRNIGGRGRGPKEYVNLENFEIDYCRKELLLWDMDGAKILIYDMDGGHFKQSVKIESRPSNIARLPGGNFILAYDMHQINTNEGHALAICSPEGEVINRYIKQNESKLPFGLMTTTTLATSADNTFSFMPQLSDAVYHITDEDVTLLYDIKFPNGTVNINNIEKFDGPLQFLNAMEGKNYLAGDHVESFKYLCFQNNGLSSMEHIFYDKELKKTIRVKNLLFGSSIAIDEKDCFWAAIDYNNLKFSKEKGVLIDKLKASNNGTENMPLIYYKLKSFGEIAIGSL